jgi:peptidoglycan L-alanyl-D-glutamate endopeptidase CwlK
MDADVDLNKFADQPFVIERPAEPSLLADHATKLLAKRGMRMTFGGDRDLAASVVSELSTSLPQTIAVLDRQTAKIVSETAYPTAIVAGVSRPSSVGAAPNVKEAMLLEGFCVSGRVLTGSGQETAATYAAMTGIQKKFDNQSLDFFAGKQAQASAEGATLSLRSLLAQRPRMEANVAFASYSPLEMASVAKKFTADTGIQRPAVRLVSLGSFDGYQSPRSGAEVASLRPTVDLGVDGVRYPAAPFGSQTLGPSYLPSAVFSEASLKVIQGIHPDLLKVVARAQEISKVHFAVVPKTGGLRDEATQARLKAGGHSKAKLGRHTIGYAIDLVPVNAKGRIDFSDMKGFDQIKDAMELAANELDVPVQWGGNWKRLVDKPHFELDRKVYPGPNEDADPVVVLTAFR